MYMILYIPVQSEVCGKITLKTQTLFKSIFSCTTVCTVVCIGRYVPMYVCMSARLLTIHEIVGTHTLNVNYAVFFFMSFQTTSKAEIVCILQLTFASKHGRE